MDFGDFLQKQQAMNAHVQQMNLQFATMETDFTNPMVFDVKTIKEQEKEMKVELEDDVDVKTWK